jgi:phasin family protein
MEYNKMVAGSMESTYNQMMDSFEGYAKLGIDSYEASLKVRTPEDMASFLETQTSAGQKVVDMLMADAKTYSDLGIKFFDNMRSFYESSMKTSMSAASDAVKAA